MRPNIFITGFSGSGKTSTGREVARRLGWRFVDTDEAIVRVAGQPIAAIFAARGESAFRKLEHDSLAALCEGERQVVSTGGGIVMDARNLGLMRDNGKIICLEARPETIYRRLQKQRAEATSPIVRPMLDAADPLKRIRELKARRQPSYALADGTVHTDGLTPQQAAGEVARGWELLAASVRDRPERDPDLAATVRTASGQYPVWVGWDLLDGLGERVGSLMAPGAAYIITDEGVQSHARRAQTAMEAAGIPTHMFVMPSGEQTKTLHTVQYVYRWLAERRAERGHLIVAVGGGVVGDLAGFVAATFLRGMPFAQVPTSLLAMMDAAIGGKVAVDMPSGKNLVGAFYQPRFVLADVKTLETLPARHVTSGWAEAIKHGLILDEPLLSTFEANVQPISRIEAGITTEVIRRSVAVKADVVSRDERETLGIRVLLNYGHTLGHAIEAADGYRSYLHGEAVSIGMMGAADISHEMGLLAPEMASRQRDVLQAFGLPLVCGEVDARAVMEAMRSDKKTAGRTIQWVLLERIGKAVTRNDVPNDLVERVLERLSH